jgi:hypothetical protein
VSCCWLPLPIARVTFRLHCVHSICIPLRSTQDVQSWVALATEGCGFLTIVAGTFLLHTTRDLDLSLADLGRLTGPLSHSGAASAPGGGGGGGGGGMGHNSGGLGGGGGGLDISIDKGSVIPLISTGNGLGGSSAAARGKRHG